jgi:Predicted nucleoside-diphosphate-sugar epimerases
MVFLVTGGTGFVGRQVLRELHRAGHRIFILSRHADSSPARAIQQELPATIRSGDILDSKNLAEACSGIDAIIHLVGIISEVGRYTFENVHVRGTENMIRAAQQAGVKRFIHMSALGTRPDAVSRYHQSKWAAEELVRRPGLDWTIFRPSIIYGPGDGFVNLFARMSHWSPVLPLIGGGKMKFQPISVESVASAFVQSLNRADTFRQTYDLCGPETLTLEEIIDTVLSVTKRRRLKVRIPFAVATAQAFVAELMFRLIGKAPPLNRDQLKMLREDNVGERMPAEELFTLPPENFAEGINRYL